jgi:hypothetical protein
MLTVRSRLDLKLWGWVAQRSIYGCNVENLREQIELQNVARYAVLS